MYSLQYCVGPIDDRLSLILAYIFIRNLIIFYKISIIDLNINYYNRRSRYKINKNVSRI